MSERSPYEYTPYKTQLAQAIERGEGMEELTDQVINGTESFARRLKTLNTKKGWGDILDILKDEPLIPFPLRTKITLAKSVAEDIGIFIKKHPDATQEDIKNEVDRILGEKDGKRIMASKHRPALLPEDSIASLIQQIKSDPKEASRNILKISGKFASVAAHRDMKNYAKHASFIVPPPWNVYLAVFTISYHGRMAAMSVINHFRSKPISKADLRHSVYKTHLGRTLDHIGDGISDTGHVLLPVLKKIPGIGYLANYILRNTIGAVLKNTAAVLEEDNKQITDAVAKILKRTLSKDHFKPDAIAQNIAVGINKVAGVNSTKLAEELAVSYRYTRLTRTVSFVDEATRALVGYTLLGAPNGERRRKNFLKAQARKEARTEFQRKAASDKILISARRMRPRSSGYIGNIPLSYAFRSSNENRSLLTIDVHLPDGFTDQNGRSSHEADLNAPER